MNTIKNIIDKEFNGYLSGDDIDFFNINFDDLLIHNELIGWQECIITYIDVNDNLVGLLGRGDYKTFEVSLEDLPETSLKNIKFELLKKFNLS